jgi:predicted N-acetyltransferase YhbS
MVIKIREETSEDYSDIKLINDLAFGQKQEGELIANLRIRPEYIKELSLVACSGKKIVGHILFFPVTISANGSAIETISLGPMSVLPEFQKKGVGGALIINGMKKAEKMGYKSIVVLGHPGYYPKFGFSRSSLWRIKAPFDAPDEAMMAIELIPGSLEFGGGIINYPGEFYDAI